MREQLEAAIAADPDNRSNHLVYADWLSDQGDPRGELISVQLALEDTLPDKERERLLARERDLLDAHAREWLGSLGPLLLDLEPTRPTWAPKPSFSFRRGFLDTLDIATLTPPWVEALRDAGPVVARLRTLIVPDTDYDAETSGATLAELAPLPSVRRLTFGGADGDNTHANGEGLETALPNFPGLEALYIEALRLDGAAIFGLPLPGLKELRFYHSHDYPLELLASNRTLRGLEVLELRPHGLEPGDEAYLTLESMEALVGAALPLRALVFNLSTMGDRGFERLWRSPTMATLEVLDLTYGAVTDAGVRAFVAAGAGVRPRLRRLVLTGNGLTEAGKRDLAALGIEVEAGEQFDVSGDEPEYLWYGSPE